MTDSNFVVAIGASKGGIQAIQELLAELPTEFSAPIIIAVHSSEKSKLTEVLSQNKRLHIKQAEDGEKLNQNQIYVVPGAKHLFFNSESISLSGVVKDSGFRPSIDALFMTLAAQYKEKAIGVVLSGCLQDGMRGAQVIYDMRGTTIVQHPKDAEEAGMPRSVIFSDHPQKVLSASELGAWLGKKLTS